MNERRTARRQAGVLETERRSFQHFAKGDDPLGDEKFVATIRALAQEFKATFISGKKIFP